MSIEVCHQYEETIAEFQNNNRHNYDKKLKKAIAYKIHDLVAITRKLTKLGLGLEVYPK